MNSRTILIVEDDPSQAEGLGDLLHIEGYNPIFAETCYEGLKQVRTKDPPVVLLDIKLPDGSGTELLANIKEIVPECTCIMMTAFADMETTLQALNKGATHLLRKPFQPPELLAILKLTFELKDLLNDKHQADRQLLNHRDELEKKVQERTSALERSEENYRLLVENNPDPILVHDGELFVYANQATFDVLGYTRSEFLEQPIQKFVHADDLQRITSSVDTIPRGERPPAQEFRGICKDGSTLTFEIHAYPTKFNDRDVRIIIAHDVTHSRLDEIALRQSEAQYRLLIEEIPDAIIIHTGNQILFMNQAAFDLSGYEWDEAKDMPVLDFIHPDDHDLAAQRQKVFDQGGVPQVDELNYLRRDGSIIIGEAHDYPTTFDGLPARIAIIRDVTARRKAEEEAEKLHNELEQHVDERTRELRASEERYKDLIDRTPDAVWRMNRQGVITFISPAIKTISGFDAEEMTGLPPFEFRKKFLVGDSQEAARVSFERRMNGDFGLDEIVYELTYYRKDGSQYTAELRSLPVVDEDGEIIEIHGITRDITERKKAEEEQARLEELLRQSQKMEAVGQLAGGIAHDFNNLLTAINGYSEILLDELKPEDPMRHDVNEIRNAGERAATLTRQLLAFGRKQLLQPEVIDLGETITRMQDMLQRLIGERIELRVQSSPNLYMINADPGQIEQVIMNLVINARDAMQQGGTIAVSLKNTLLDDRTSNLLGDLVGGSYVMLSVTDTGVGMDEETLSHIFEPFYTTKSVEKGTGLGLSTSFGIIAQSGGGINVTSEPGKGATFDVYFPRVDSIEAGAEKDRSSTASITRGHETIMIVEDEELIRDLLKRILENLGYVVLVASHSEDALLIAEHHPGVINLMITDVIMPRMNGHELMARISPIRPDMSVLFMSGYDEGMVADQGLVDMDRQFLQKPFRSGEVARKIREILDNRSLTDKPM